MTSTKNTVQTLIERKFTTDMDTIHNMPRKNISCEIKAEDGSIIFKQDNFEVPKSWSLQAATMTAAKYAYGDYDDPNREKSVFEIVRRIAKTITKAGVEQGLFVTSDESESQARIFYDELSAIMLGQYAVFNSPVLFNIGTPEKQQSSACFIVGLEDNMESITDWWKTEALLFKNGSGSGVNVSKLRAKGEKLSGGGFASGPLSFMKVSDSLAGSIKSGGKTRRAAKMVVIDDRHPEFMSFVKSKSLEETKARSLIKSGYEGGFEGEAYSTVAYQNENHSVRLSNAFMSSYVQGMDWEFKSVSNKETVLKMPSREILRTVAQCAYETGDPGVQFTDTMNSWNTVPATGSINATNPCSEFVFLDDTACNLASHNLAKYLKKERDKIYFDFNLFIHATRLMILAQEILVNYSYYPTEEIGINSRRLRPLGLGYCGLGELLMKLGVPYDSDIGRQIGGGLMSILTSEAYYMSARLAEILGCFEAFNDEILGIYNKDVMINVIERHSNSNNDLREEMAKRIPSISQTEFPDPTRVFLLALKDHIDNSKWYDALELGHLHGFRNAQVSLLAPTGTISFFLDARTTGIEPFYALTMKKTLAGGGHLWIINDIVPEVLSYIGYNSKIISKAISYLEKHGELDGLLEVAYKDYPIFHVAVPPNSKNTISSDGHLLMMKAVGGFVSGWISKTVNLPESATVEDIEEIYYKAWQLGLKSVAIYRNNSKGVQVYEVKENKKAEEKGLNPVQKIIESSYENYLNKDYYEPPRFRLPEDRRAFTHKFSVGGQEGYLMYSVFPNTEEYPANLQGKPGELFVKISKEGTTISGLMDAFCKSSSVLLQHGASLEELVDKFKGFRFEPAGMTSNHKEVPLASSLIDYIFKLLESRFLKKPRGTTNGLNKLLQQEQAEMKVVADSDKIHELPLDTNGFTSRNCECGTPLPVNQPCFECPNCFRKYGNSCG